MVGTLTKAPGSLFSIPGRLCLYTGSGPRPACVYVRRPSKLLLVYGFVAVFRLETLRVDRKRWEFLRLRQARDRRRLGYTKEVNVRCDRSSFSHIDQPHLAGQEVVHDMWMTVLTPSHGFPESLYTDNGKHFIGSETVSLFESHGTFVSQASISQPSSVGLAERNVQLVLAQIRRWVYEKGSQARNNWGRSFPQIMPNINGRLLRFQGFTPAEILMGYNPQWTVTRHGEEPDADPPNTIDVTSYINTILIQRAGRVANSTRAHLYCLEIGIMMTNRILGNLSGP